MTLVSAPAAIPFRPESGGLATEAGTALLLAVVLLGAALAFALYARRKGWLARWTGVAPAALAHARRLRVVETHRLSRRTVVYRLAREPERLVVESEANARVVPLEGGSSDRA
jgi:hypothetical protein